MWKLDYFRTECILYKGVMEHITLGRLKRVTFNFLQPTLFSQTFVFSIKYQFPF